MKIVVKVVLLLLLVSLVGLTIAWCIYANDTSNNWNGTSCVSPFSYTTTSANIALDLVILTIFSMVIGFDAIYLDMKREAIVWPFISTIIFVTNILFAASIEFEGGAMASSANYILIKLNRIFTFIALITTVKLAFDLFVKK